MRMLLVVLASASFVVVACSSSAPSSTPSSANAGADGGAGSGPFTVHKDVEPVLQKVCQNCHVAGGIAPFSLVTFADAKAVAGSIVAQTAARSMPPWGAQDTSECKPPMPWKNDLRLSEQEIAILAAWHSGGDLEGDPKDAPPPRTAAPIVNLPGALSLAPPAPFSLAGSNDTFRCFVLDPKITATKYLTGTNFVPTNKTIVHHALAFSIPATARVPGDAYDCFGGPKVDGANLVAAWAPGGVPSEYPADVGLALEAGTRFVMQVHYHPHANGTQDPDATSFEYKVTDTAPAYRAVPTLIGNFTTAVGADGRGVEPGPDDPGGVPTFLIPKDAPAHVETMHFVMPSFGPTTPTIRILGLGAHMHLAGRDEKITLTRAGVGGAESCLLQEPAWSFNWQRGYQYDAPIESLPTIAPGDVLRMRCTYDNTMTNADLAAARREAGITEPTDISLGESTMDEMCLGAFTFVYKAK
ncbi:MAG: hypothetical protein NVS3B10_14090 [Polyangiales bacterium]